MPDRDPFLAAAANLLDDSLAELRKSVEGVPAPVLDRKPGGDDTNSVAVLAVHVLHSTREWLSTATGARLPPRDRPSEFRTKDIGPDALLATLDSLSTDCRGILADAGQVDWAAMRPTDPTPDSERVTSAWALLHALAHLREHVGQLALTRQLLTS